MTGPYEELTGEQVEHFIEHGHVVVRGAFDPEEARRRIALAWVRLGYDPGDPATWAEPSVHMPTLERVEVATFAPRAWAAARDLLGGAERVRTPWMWGDGFIGNFGEGADRPWRPPGPETGGWHKDGDFFRHFLDSPEQGLLTIVLWTDVVSRGGATMVATDSVGIVARYLAEHPEGVAPDGFPTRELIAECRAFAEATGEAGDVYLLHPYVLHAKGQNVLRRPRFITNPPAQLVAPMRFDRPDPADHSPVERAVLRGMGVERYEFEPTAPREAIVPERVRRQERMRIEEEARLAAARG